MNNTSTKEDRQMQTLKVIAGALVIVGGLNWGLVAIGEFDLVAWLVGEEFGETNALSRIVYGLVGLSAAYLAVQATARDETSPAIGSAESRA
jgi:uncharacterized membrane protein YuzA (DUF378 family)